VIPVQMWHEMQFVYCAFLYYKDDDSFWHDNVYDRHIKKLEACKGEWTHYLHERLPPDYDKSNPDHQLGTFAHALRWTEDDVVNARDWKDKCLAGKWRGKVAIDVASNLSEVYTGIHSEKPNPTEVDMGRPRKVKPEEQALANEGEVAVVTSKITGDLSTLVEKYISLRDRKQAIVNEAKEKAAKFDAVLDKMEGMLLSTFNDLGMDSVKTSAGTAYKSTRTSATVADWDSVLNFIRDTEAFNMLERRVAKAAVVEYRDANGALPPGIDWREEVTINVRRS